MLHSCVWQKYSESLKSEEKESSIEEKESSNSKYLPRII